MDIPHHIVVTGGAGFVGTHLIQEILCTWPDAIVHSLDNYFTGSAAAHVQSSQVIYLQGNTAEISQIWRNRDLPAPQIVFHLGEYSRIPQSFAEIDTCWKYNIVGTKEVVDFAHKSSALLVYAGSSSKFGNDGRDENLSPYAWTKAKNVEYIRNFSTWFGLDYVVTYLYNAYGPGQLKSGKYATVIGMFERQFESGVPLTVAAPGTQTRDFTYVKDIAAGLVKCAAHGRGDGYHLGTGNELSILEVASMFGGECIMVPARPGARQSARADPSKAKALGWAPKTALADYVGEFVRELA